MRMYCVTLIPSHSRYRKVNRSQVEREFACLHITFDHGEIAASCNIRARAGVR